MVQSLNPLNYCTLILLSPRYYCSLDGAGLRRDRLQRPELHKGTVDYIVSNEYSTEMRDQRHVHIFAIDVSSRSMVTGLTRAAVMSVCSF